MMWEEVKGWSSNSWGEIVTCCKNRPSTEAPKPTSCFHDFGWKLDLISQGSPISRPMTPQKVSQPPNVPGLSCILKIWLWQRQWSEFKQVVAVEYAGGGLLVEGGGAIFVEHRLVRRRRGGHQTANFLFNLQYNFFQVLRSVDVIVGYFAGKNIATGETSLVISSLTIMTFITRLLSSLDKFHHRITFITK